MNRSEMVAIIARQSEMQPPAVDTVIGAFVDLLVLNLQVGESVTIRGLGRFDPKVRPSTTLKHPRTGATITTGERNTVSFRPSMLLKGRLNPLAAGTDPNRSAGSTTLPTGQNAPSSPRSSTGISGAASMTAAG